MIQKHKVYDIPRRYQSGMIIRRTTLDGDIIYETFDVARMKTIETIPSATAPGFILLDSEGNATLFKWPKEEEIIDLSENDLQTALTITLQRKGQTIEYLFM